MSEDFPPFPPPVPGASAEQLKAFLAERWNVGGPRRPRPPEAGAPEPEPPPPPPSQPRPEPSTVIWTGAPMPPPWKWAEADDFDWLRGFSESMCVAVVHDVEPQHALDLIVRKAGETLATEAVTDVMSAKKARQWAMDAAHLPRYATALEAGLVSGTGGWTLIVEDNGYLLAQQSVLLPLSTGTAAFVMYWAMTGWRMYWAVDGTMIRLQEADDRGENARTGRRLPQEDGLDLERYRPNEYGLALMQRLTGVRVTRDDLMLPGKRIAICVLP